MSSFQRCRLFFPVTRCIIVSTDQRARKTSTAAFWDLLQLCFTRLLQLLLTVCKKVRTRFISDFTLMQVFKKAYFSTQKWTFCAATLVRYGDLWNYGIIQYNWKCREKPVLLLSNCLANIFVHSMHLIPYLQIITKM